MSSDPVLWKKNNHVSSLCACNAVEKKIRIRVLKHYRTNHLSMLYSSESTILHGQNSANKGANVTYGADTFPETRLTKYTFKNISF